MSCTWNESPSHTNDCEGEPVSAGLCATHWAQWCAEAESYGEPAPVWEPVKRSRKAARIPRVSLCRYCGNGMCACPNR